MNVYCIEYHKIDTNLYEGYDALYALNNSNSGSCSLDKKPKFNKMILSPSSCNKARPDPSSNVLEPVSHDIDQDIEQRLYGLDRDRNDKRSHREHRPHSMSSINPIHRMSLHNDNVPDQYANVEDSDYDQYGIKTDDKLDICDIVRENDAFLFICSVNDKQSFVQCIDIINNIKKDEFNYNYRKPIIIVVTKCDLPNMKHQLSECDIAEFAVDIGVPFIRVSPGNRLYLSQLTLSFCVSQNRTTCLI